MTKRGAVREVRLEGFGLWRFERRGTEIAVYHWLDGFGWCKVGTAFAGGSRPSPRRWRRWAGWNCGE